MIYIEPEHLITSAEKHRVIVGRTRPGGNWIALSRYTWSNNGSLSKSKLAYRYPGLVDLPVVHIDEVIALDRECNNSTLSVRDWVESKIVVRLTDPRHPLYFHNESLTSRSS